MITSKKLPFISVVIPAYNEQENITKVLKSLKNQNYKGRFEIIVVNNNSTDFTAKIARQFRTKVVFETLKGVAHARQKGFEAARGEIIASTDADSILPTNWLSHIVELFQIHKDAVMVSGMFSFYNGSKALNFWNWCLNYWQFVIFNWYSGANMAIKRQAFKKVGGFNTSLPLSEDSDLGVRLRKIGKVYRFANFKVKTSARRYNQLGFWGGLWDYCYNYAKFKLDLKIGTKTTKVSFRSGSEIPKLGVVPKLAIHFSVIIFVLAAFLGSAFEIKPVRAQVIKREKQFSHHIPHVNVDVDMPNIKYPHYVKHP